MHYGVYGSGSNLVVRAIVEGLKALGHKVTLQRVEVWAPYMARKDFDRVVVAGLRGKYSEAWRHHRAEGCPVIIREAPHFRGLEDQKRMSVTDHAWIPSFDCAPDRLRALGVTASLPREIVKGGILLVCGQTAMDTQHGMTGDELGQWLAMASAAACDRFELRPEWRPHPMARDLPRPAGVGPEASPGETVLDALTRATAMLSYNSTTGIEAIRLGCPVFRGGPATYSSAVWHVGPNGDIEMGDGLDVEALLSRVAYTQWSYDELRAGAWVPIVEKELSGDWSPLAGASAAENGVAVNAEPTPVSGASGHSAEWPEGEFKVGDLAELRGASRGTARREADLAVDAGALRLIAEGGRGRHNPRLYTEADRWP